MLKRNKNKILKNIIIMILIMLMCTFISSIFEYLHMSESNIVMIYLLGILLYSFIAEGYFYSLVASICFVLLYNFFFTEPYYTFKVNNPDYIITFLVMFLVGFLTSMLTIRVKLGRQQVEERKKYISSLYDIERKLLDVKSVVNLSKISAEELANQLQANITVTFFNTSGGMLCQGIAGNDIFKGEKDCLARVETYQSGTPCGYGTALFSDVKAFYTPILSQNGVLGVIGVSLLNGKMLEDTQKSFLDVIAPQIAVVLERERIYEKQKRAHMEMQAERLRSDMLRTISHDLRTPLTGIMGLTSTMLENYNYINDDMKKEFIQNIYSDADWLNVLVENILQTTRFEEKRVKLNIGQEAAEEIITEAVTHVKKHDLEHKIVVKIPDEIILIQVDGVLIRQVLVNILNNAMNYSPKDSEIIVVLRQVKNRAYFEIQDNGPGISEDVRSHLFERFYHRKIDKKKSRKGMGLGLALCKSIIEAHNGEISIRDNKPQGTIVSFYVLSEKESRE